MVNDKQVRLKLSTLEILQEVDRQRVKEKIRTKEVFAKLMKDVRGMWTPNESILFLAEFYLKHRKR